MNDIKTIHALASAIASDALELCQTTDSELILATLNTCLKELHGLHTPPKRTDFENVKKEFGQTLRKHRKAHKLTQEELSINSGVKRCTISRYEHGKHLCTFKTLIYFTEILGYDFLIEVIENIRPFIAQRNKQ